MRSAGAASGSWACRRYRWTRSSARPGSGATSAGIFRPTTGRVRERWEQLTPAQRRGAVIPPIEVYRVGGQHFVSDGHHRVSIAAATGQQTIDADVTEILTAKPPNRTTRPQPAIRLLKPRNGPSVPQPLEARGTA